MPLSKPRPPVPSESGREEERLWIAQKLHDGPCQTFSSAQLLAQILLQDAEAGVVGDGSLHRDLAATISSGVNELHEIMNQLRKGGARPETAVSSPRKPAQAQPDKPSKPISG
ncbi:MAG: histidine kinase [Opitutaceae bacterium]